MSSTPNRSHLEACCRPGMPQCGGNPDNIFLHRCRLFDHTSFSVSVLHSPASPSPVRPSRGHMDIPTLCRELLACGQSLQASNLEEKFNQAALLMMTLKKTNRLKLQQLEAKQHSIDNRKDAVNKAQLRLENLLYKQAYLLREIRDYKDFNSTELNKIESEIGVKIGMDEYSSDLSQLHKESLAVLKKELQQRKLHRKELLELEKKKESLSNEVNSKRKRLESFPEKVSKMKTLAAELFSTSTATAVDTTIAANTSAAVANTAATAQLPLSDCSALQDIHHLTNPLYTLYHSLQAISCDSSENASEKVKVSIVEESTGKWGVDLTVTLANLKLFTSADDCSGISSGGETDVKSTASVSASITVRFLPSALTQLVSATITSLQLFAFPASSSTPVALHAPGSQKDTLLTSLFPNQPASIDLFQTAATASAADAPSAAETGKGAYLWVQWICGMRPLPPPQSPSGGGGSVQSDVGVSSGKDMFYSLNTVLDAVSHC